MFTYTTKQAHISDICLKFRAGKLDFVIPALHGKCNIQGKLMSF